MRKALTIAWKDLRSEYRNVAALAMMFVAPLVLASLLGLAFGGDEGFSITTTKVAVVEPSQDGGTGIFTSVLKNMNTENEKLVTLSESASEEEAKGLVDDGKADVALVVPAGIEETLADSTGVKTASILIYQNPTKTIGPAIVAGSVEQVVAGLNAARAAAYAAGSLAYAAGERDSERIAEIARAGALTYSGQMQAGPAYNLEFREPQVAAGDKAKNPGVAGQVLVGMMVFFMLIAALNVARTILDEDYAGTLPRLFTTPTPLRTILGGKFMSVVLVVLIQAAILLVAGWLIFGTDWGAPLPVVALVLSCALASAAVGIFILSLSRTPAQAGAIGTGVVLVLALVGGNFVGGFPEGGFFSIARRFTPNGWMLEGWNISMRGGSLGDIWLQILVILAFAIVLFSIGVALFRRRYA